MIVCNISVFMAHGITRRKKALKKTDWNRSMLAWKTSRLVAGMTMKPKSDARGLMPKKELKDLISVF